MRLCLEPDEVLCLPKGARGFTVRCERGVAWLTQAGDPADHVLAPGDAQVLGRRGKVTVWASGACVLHLEGPSPRRTLGLCWQPPTAAPRPAQARPA